MIPKLTMPIFFLSKESPSLQCNKFSEAAEMEALLYSPLSDRLKLNNELRLCIVLVSLLSERFLTIHPVRVNSLEKSYREESLNWLYSSSGELYSSVMMRITGFGDRLSVLK